MKNKVIIFFFTIFQLVILNAYADDQISFDVTEIEILDGGNRIIGKIEVQSIQIMGLL